MNEELEFVTVTDPKAASLESVGPEFLKEGLLKAREKTWEAFRQIKAQIKIGMTETEAREVSLQIMSEMGSEKNWHKPHIRFGSGTALSFHDSVQPSYQLAENDPVYVDIGPVWKDEISGLEYEGDVGDTYVMGENAEAQKCATVARELFFKAQEKWQQEKLSGHALYQFLKVQSELLGYEFLEKVSGHRISDYSHMKYSKQRLANVVFEPAACLWVLEVQILDGQKRFGAFYEDILTRSIDT